MFKIFYLYYSCLSSRSGGEAGFPCVCSPDWSARSWWSGDAWPPCRPARTRLRGSGLPRPRLHCHLLSRTLTWRTWSQICQWSAEKRCWRDSQTIWNLEEGAVREEGGVVIKLSVVIINWSEVSSKLFKSRSRAAPHPEGIKLCIFSLRVSEVIHLPWFT